MISKDATISNGRVIRKAKTTDTIYKSFMLYKAGTNEFEAKSNIDGTTYKGSLDDVKRQIDKYWEKKDAEEVLKKKTGDVDYSPITYKGFVIDIDDYGFFIIQDKEGHFKGKESSFRKAQALIDKWETKDTDFNLQNIIGKHNDVPDDQFDANELQLGIETEMEHTDSDEVAKSIAKDHLMEIKDYYTRLKRMEEEAKA